jgi:hypothetical protein
VVVVVAATAGVSTSVAVAMATDLVTEHRKGAAVGSRSSSDNRKRAASIDGQKYLGGTGDIGSTAANRSDKSHIKSVGNMICFDVAVAELRLNHLLLCY